MFILKKFFSKKIIIGLSILVFAILIILINLSLAPQDFPQDEIIKVQKGQTVSQVANLLNEKQIIKSPFMFKLFVAMISTNRSVKATDYLFEEPQSVLRVAYRLVNGIQDLPLKKITIIEGMTAQNIADTIKKVIPKFDSKSFMVLAKPYEGYLFPETYFFYENVSPEDVLNQLRDTFKEKIKTELLAIQAFGKPLEDVIKMASIVEKEATNLNDKKIIAGILWKRLEIGMPLQVDPPFYYILGKDSASLSRNDLASDSPYNTYTHKGLPPTPISNPSLDTIQATLTPIKTNYLFYLSDKKGTMHYAVDHDGHVANKDKYIR